MVGLSINLSIVLQDTRLLSMNTGLEHMLTKMSWNCLQKYSCQYSGWIIQLDKYFLSANTDPIILMGHQTRGVPLSVQNCYIILLYAVKGLFYSRKVIEPLTAALREVGINP